MGDGETNPIYDLEFSVDFILSLESTVQESNSLGLFGYVAIPFVGNGPWENLCQEFKIPYEFRPLPKVNDIYEGVNRKTFYPINNQHLLQLVKERYELPNQKFLLSVSTLEPRKNILRLINAYSELSEALRNEYHLVLVGRKGWKWNSVKIPAQCKGQIHFTGFVRDEHLPALYTSASGFCYVSLYEGFGLPVLEALACGTPVLVSNTSSLPELVGEVGILCDPLNNESIQRGLESLIQKSKVTQVDHQCMRQSWNFSWQKTWKETLNYLT